MTTTRTAIRPRASAVLLHLGPGALALGLVACASSGPGRSAKAEDTMAQTHASLTKVRRQIDLTLTSLGAVMSAGPDRLRAAFDRYAKDVDKLRSEAEVTKKRFERMKAKRDDYIAAWGKERSQVRDEELRQLSEARRADVKASLERAVESLRIANDAFNPFMSDLGDVRRVLGNDLTQAGQALVANTAVVKNANDKGARVAQSIDVALVEIANMAGQLSPTGSMK